MDPRIERHGSAAAPRSTLLLAALGALAALAALRLARDGAMWTTGEGVYALTARMLIHGGDLYGSVAVAQPPNSFLAGGVILAARDSIDGLRDGIGLLQVITGILAAATTWRLTGSRLAAVAAAPIALLTPWAVHENATFIPEVVALPLLLGAGLLAARPRTAGPAGVLAAVAVFCKLPLLAPLVALWLVAADRRRYAIAAAVALAGQAVLYTLIFGSGLWEGTIRAELATGHHAVGQIAGIAAQAAWNAGPLVLLAAAAVWLGMGRTRDRTQLRCSAALAAGMLVTLVSLSKRGTGLYVVAAIEPVCVPLAVAGGLWAVTQARRRGRGGLRPVGTVMVVAVAALVLAGQSASLLLSPDHPRFFVRPGAGPGYARDLSGPGVDAAVAAARSCPPGRPYSGLPLIAFIAHRPMPGDQPDSYIIQAAAPRLAAERQAAAVGVPRCP